MSTGVIPSDVYPSVLTPLGKAAFQMWVVKLLTAEAFALNKNRYEGDASKAGVLFRSRELLLTSSLLGNVLVEKGSLLQPL